MKVVFFDKIRETYRTVHGVEQVSCGKIKTNGRYVNQWILDMLYDHVTLTFKMKDYELVRVELEGDPNAKT